MKRRIPASLMMAAIFGNDLAIPVRQIRAKEKPRFSEEELAHLATLEGKEKRAFVRELQAKYRK